MKFSELGLAEPFLRATESLGYETATPIQAQAIPVVLEGRDLIGCAQTGTGKTAAFTLPMLDKLLQTMPERPKHKPAKGRNGQHRSKGPKPQSINIRALVLSPTRELAAQIGNSLNNYGKFTPLRQTVIFGGVSQYPQVKALRFGVDALVATPGRLLDLVNQGHVDLSKVEVLVFDEADQMLDMGFLPDLKRIVALVPEKRQTLMFSATMPAAIRRLAEQWLIKPASIEVGTTATPVERITQSVHMVDKKRKPDLLARFLTESPKGRTLVFSRTKHGADKIVKRLEKEGLRATAIHGNKSQNARSRALAQFKSKNPPILVATDIAARGLDVNNVSHVVNFDLPESPESYVHRIGRTARAGAEGVAVSFCAGDERGLLKQIERLTKCSIPVEPTIEGFEPTDPVSHTFKRGGGSKGGQRRGGGGGGGFKSGGFKSGGGYKGKSAQSKSGSKPRRFGSKAFGSKPNGSKSNGSGSNATGSNAKGSSEEKPRRQKGSTDFPLKGRKAKPGNGAATATADGAPRKRKRRRPSAK